MDISKAAEMSLGLIMSASIAAVFELNKDKDLVHAPRFGNVAVFLD